MAGRNYMSIGEILVTLKKSEARNANVLKRVGDLYAAIGDTGEAIAAYRTVPVSAQRPS